MAPDPWSLSTNRKMPGGRANREEMARGPNGRILCRWCSLETPPGRLTFCSDWCVHEWRLRSDPGYLRQQVFERDHGICVTCGMDPETDGRRIRRLRPAKRTGVIRDWGLKSLRRSSLWD